MVEADDAAAAAAKSLRPTSTAEAMRVGATSEDLSQAEFVNGSNSNSLGESPTTRLGYLNQATFDSNKSKRGVFGSGHNNNSSTTNEGKPPKHAGGDCGTQTNMLAENSAVARVALDAHAARAPSPAEGMNSKLLRVRSMVTTEGRCPTYPLWVAVERRGQFRSDGRRRHVDDRRRNGCAMHQTQSTRC